MLKRGRAAPAEVADRPRCKGPDDCGSSSSMICIARIFGAPDDRSARERRPDRGRPGRHPCRSTPSTVATRGDGPGRTTPMSPGSDDPDRPVFADPAQVVPLEVDDHGQLGAILRSYRSRSRTIRSSSAGFDRPGDVVPLIGLRDDPSAPRRRRTARGWPRRPPDPSSRDQGRERGRAQGTEPQIEGQRVGADDRAPQGSRAVNRCDRFTWKTSPARM